MGRTSRTAITAATLVALVLPLACGDDGDDEPTTTTAVTTTAAETTTSGATATTSADTATTEAPTTTTAAGTLIEVTVAGGDVQGGGRKTVDKDEPVTIRVTSDEADEIHVHGYDLSADLEAGVPGELTFTPNAAGIYEVELEERGLLLIELEVR
jgi:hypothetical protein